jgi:hypothetical protein
MHKSMLKTFIIFAVTVCSISAKGDDDCATDATKGTNTYDEETVNCYRAFCALPLEARRGDISGFGFSGYVHSYKDIYTRYDKSCFRPIADLKEYSQEFLKSIYGVLFYHDRGSLQLTCSAFRISEDVVVTAGHCIHGTYPQRAINQFSFRSLSSPDKDVPVLNEVVIPVTAADRIANDFEDYAVLRTARSDSSFEKHLDDFRSIARQGTWLLVAGLNGAAYVLDGEDPSRWSTSFRFTKVQGAQWLPINQLHPEPSEQAAKRCIYYNAPTFGGLSGAPIVGSEQGTTPNSPRKLFVFGIHLRSGAPDAAHLGDADCGSYPAQNVGLVLPPDVLAHVKR